MHQVSGLLAASARYFLAVAEAGSLRAAARHLNVAASAVSRQIAMLERDLGIMLFERAGRSLRLSPAGEELKRTLHATNLLHEQSLDQLNALRGLKSGHIRIATVESVSDSLLPQILDEFSRHHPGVQVTVTVAGSDAVTELVRTYDADVGFTFNPSSFEGLEVAHALDFALGAVMHPRHELARTGNLTLRDCLRFPVAWPSRGLSLRTLLDPMVRRQKLQVKPAFECNSLRVMAGLARRGVCLAFQTPVGIERDVAEGKLVFVPLSDRHVPPDRMMLVQRLGLDGNIAARAFVDRAVRLLPKTGHVPKNRTTRAN